MIIETELTGVMATAVNLAALFLVGAFVLAAVRLIIGPTLPDRVVALDLLTMLVVAFLTLFALASGVGAYLDAALALALVGFLATIAFARFVDLTPEQNPGERR
ncbi:MAG: multiple resistance and pH regulation protein F [Alphaproteobacteria bacterium]|jgi:multicomponent Na+:H+ antiporter subunit F|nr:multiple resistance and pH regulation protein F [Alphaproteobacteria bacterium]